MTSIKTTKEPNWKNRLCAVAFSFLLIASVLAGVMALGVGPVDTAKAEQSSAVYYDDFEDGDYDGWTSGDESNMGITSDSYHGNYSLRVNDTLPNNGAFDNTRTIWSGGNEFDTGDNFEMSGTYRPDGTGSGGSDTIRLGVTTGQSDDERAMAFHNLEENVTYLSTSHEAEIPAETINDSFTGQWVHFRFQYDGGTMRAKFWEAGTPEPADWQLTRDFKQFVGNFEVNAGDGSEGREIYVDEIDAGGNAVTGQLVDKETGEPIPNATVEAVGVDYEALNDSIEDADAEADRLLDEAQNPLPDAWDPEYSLSDHMDAGSTYALVHQRDDWSTGRTTILREEVDDPRLSTDPEQDVIISLWDPEKDSGFLEGPVDGSHPGGVVEGSVVIEQLTGTGESVETKTVETQVEFETTGSFAEGWGGHEYHAVRTSLPEGVYRVHPEGAPERGYVFTVGDPNNIADMITQSLENEAGKLSEQAEQVRSNIEGGTFARVTTTTNENGEFSLRLPSTIERASIQAYRGDGQLLQDITGPSIDDLRTQAASEDYNGTFTIAPPERHVVPADDITIEGYTTDTLPHLGITEFGEWQDWLEDQFLDEDLTELQNEYDERFSEMERDSLERVYQDHRTLVETVPGAEGRYLDRSEFSSIQDADSLTDGELSTETQNMQIAIANVGNVALPDPGDNPVDISNGEINAEIPLPDGVDEDTISPEIHWSNGTAAPISDEYWSIESSSGVFGSRTLVIDGYPIGENDPAAFDIRVLGGGENGVVDDRVSGVNPAFDGSIPEISAVDLNMMSPGPGDRVSMTFRAGETEFDNVQGVEVFGPDGAPVNVSTVGDRASFKTAGEGEHFIRATVVDSTGEAFVQSFRMKAHEEPRTNPPTVRSERAVGDRHFALVGEKLQNAEISTDDRIGETRVVAETPRNTDISELHLQIREAMVGDDLEVRIVKGSDQKAIQQHVRLTIHERLNDNAILWRNEAPITRDGSTRYGEVSERQDGDKHLIRSYTTERGQATISINRDPGLLEQARHRVGVILDGLPSPSMLYTGLPIESTQFNGHLGLLIAIASIRRQPPFRPSSIRNNASAECGQV